MQAKGMPRKKMNNTKIKKTNYNTIAITFYGTSIVEFNENHIILNTSGYKTATTKDRMNKISQDFKLGFEVLQINKIWYVNFKNKTIKFFDNMLLERK